MGACPCCPRAALGSSAAYLVPCLDSSCSALSSPVVHAAPCWAPCPCSSRVALGSSAASLAPYLACSCFTLGRSGVWVEACVAAGPRSARVAPGSSVACLVPSLDSSCSALGSSVVHAGPACLHALAAHALRLAVWQIVWFHAWKVRTLRLTVSQLLRQPVWPKAFVATQCAWQFRSLFTSMPGRPTL